MPIYEYTCQRCLSSFEKLQTLVEMDNYPDCPNCGGASSKQLSVFSMSGIKTQQERPTGVPASGSPCCAGGCGCG